MMPSGLRFVGELHVPGSSARTRHRGAFTISTRCRDTRERAGSSSPWPPVGAETSRSQRLLRDSGQPRRRLSVDALKDLLLDLRFPPGLTWSASGPLVSQTLSQAESW